MSDSYSRPLTVTLADGMLSIQQRILGDGDGDGRVTAVDALIALRMAAQAAAADPPLDIPVELTLDMDGDGAITIEDARKILVLAGSERVN